MIVILMLGHPLAYCPKPMSPAPTSEEIREAIKNLDDSQYRVRAQAAKKIAERGQIGH